MVWYDTFIASKQEKINTTTMSATATTIIEVELKKCRPGCTGMFWRPDPTAANNNE